MAGYVFVSRDLTFHDFLQLMLCSHADMSNVITLYIFWKIHQIKKASHT